MSVQNFTNGAAQAAGSNLTNAIFSTPQGHAALVGTAAVVVAAAPVVVVAAIGAGLVYAGWTLIDWLDS